jgi:hypothetical protein
MSLADKNPLLKIYGLELVERLWQTAVRENLWSPEYRRRVMSIIESISHDHGVVWIYKNSGFISYEVGEISKIMRVNLAKIGN